MSLPAVTAAVLQTQTPSSTLQVLQVPLAWRCSCCFGPFCTRSIATKLCKNELRPVQPTSKLEFISATKLVARNKLAQRSHCGAAGGGRTYAGSSCRTAAAAQRCCSVQKAPAVRMLCCCLSLSVLQSVLQGNNPYVSSQVCSRVGRGLSVLNEKVSCQWVPAHHMLYQLIAAVMALESSA
jgi:hypothetical protein